MLNLQDKFLLEVTKIFSLLVITIFTILFAIVPLVKKQFKLNPWIINCSQSLTCGMFLSLTFLDFFPRAMQIFDRQQAFDIFPVPFIVSLCSYTLMLILHKLFFFSRDYRNKKKHVIKDFFRTSITYDKQLTPQKIHVGQWEVRKYSKSPMVEQNESIIESKPMDQYKSTFLKNTLNAGNLIQKRNYNSFLHSNPGEFEEDQDDQAEYIEYTSKKQRTSQQKYIGQSKKQYTKTHEMIDSHLSSIDSEISPQTYRYQTYSQSYYILLVFSFQSLVEGLSLGVQNQFGTILFLTMASLLHKFIETSMLSATLILHKVKYNQLAFILCIYSFVEPLAIFLGWMLQDDILSVGFIISFVAGNFLYITASEGIIDVFEMGDQTKTIKIVQFIILLFGVGTHFLVWFAQKQLKL